MKNKLPLLVTLLLVYNLSFTQSAYLNFTTGLHEQTNVDHPPKANMQNFHEKGMKLTFDFSGAHIFNKTNNNTIYQIIQITGLVPQGETGAPAVPIKNQLIAIPENSIAKVKVVESNYTEHKNFMLYPTLAPAKDTKGAKQPVFKKDEKIYSTNAFFPQEIASLNLLGYSRETGLGQLKIFPVQFNPVTKMLRTYTSITLEITFEGKNKTFKSIATNNTQNYINTLKRAVINASSIPNKIKTPTSGKSTTKELIIITHEAYKTQADELAAWKRQLGISTEVIAQSNWSPSQIKNVIEQRYNNYNPKPDYVLFIGDHTDPNAVPGELRESPDEGGSFTTDTYYVCMGGTYDYIPDITKGRISVSSATEAQVVIDKIINYERNPANNPDFYTNVLTCAQFQDDDNNKYADRRFTHTSEDIHDYLQNENGYNLERIYFTEYSNSVSNLRYNNGYYSNGQLLPAELRSDDFDWNGNQNDITAAINNGKFLIFHRDHGYVGGSGWSRPYYTTTTMNTLSNGNLLPIVFSINCHTGEYQLSNCFAEKLLRMENKGAVGVVGAAYFSFSGYNDALSLGMIDAIWSDPGLYGTFGYGGTGTNYTIGEGNNIYAMGDVLKQGLYAMLQNWSGNTNSYRYQFELFHYFGDPTMKIWTSDPNANQLTATHNTSISCNENSFEITESTPGALATLIQNNHIIAENYITEDGSLSLTYNISEPCETITLTLSNHNQKPYISELPIVGNCPYPPSVATDSVSNINDISATLYGKISGNNGAEITNSGVLFSTIPGSTLDDNEIIVKATNPTVNGGNFNLEVYNLEPSTYYYARTYAINEIGASYGEEVLFKTVCAYSVELPHIINFEQGKTPDCWQENGDNWIYQSGGHSGYPSYAHGGNYNALFYNGSHTNKTSSLISQTFNFNAFENVTLSFWHAQSSWGEQQDKLSVYYKNSPTNDWVLLQEYEDEIQLWTEEIIELPELSTNYQLKFEANATYGHGIVLDDIELTGVAKPTYPLTFYVNHNYNETPMEGVPININQTLIETNSNGEAEIALINGNYTYTIEHEEFASIEGSITIENESEEIYISLTGTKQPTNSYGIIYPNPTNGQLTIDWPDAENFSIRNLVGQILMKHSINKHKTIDLSNLKSGIYLIQIQTSNENITKQIILRK